MSQQQDLGSFFKETRKILTDYLEARLEVYRLQGVRSISRMAGYFIWVIVFLFLLWLLLIFAGIVTGLWLSELTGSYLKGFGITTLIIVGFCILVFVFRKALFVDPIIRAALQHSHSDKEGDDEETLDD